MPARHLVLTLCAMLAAHVAHAERPPLTVVPDLDLKRYAGTWFEIARLPNRFERACASNVTAEYTVRADGRIDVVNRCRQADGTTRQARGIARRRAGLPASVLEVRFAPAILSFLPAVWGDYQVIALGRSYDFAMVGSSNRQYLWLLARQPRLDEARYHAAMARAREQGFDVDRVTKTAHRDGGGRTAHR